MSTLQLLDAAGRRRSPATLREALDACSCAQPPAPDLNEGRGAAPVRPAPAAPRPRRRDGPRGCLAEGDPTAARPRQPRRDVGISRRHRHRGDHRHSPQPAGTDDFRERRTEHLSPRALLLAWERRRLLATALDARLSSRASARASTTDTIALREEAGLGPRTSGPGSGTVTEFTTRRPGSASAPRTLSPHSAWRPTSGWASHSSMGFTAP